MSAYTTLKRTSMSLDVETLDNLAILAEKWGTSKSEVIRRVVRKSREEEAAKPGVPIHLIDAEELGRLTLRYADRLGSLRRLIEAKQTKAKKANR